MKADQTYQLDLLEWRASATIHVFPPARRMGLVRVVADELSHDEESDLWAAVVDRITAELRALGVLSENEIGLLLLDFRDAVQAELDRFGPGDGGTPQGVPAMAAMQSWRNSTRAEWPASNIERKLP